MLFGLTVTMPDGDIADITFTVSSSEDCGGTTVDVGFSSTGLSFGNSLGQAVTGWTSNGSVKIADE